MTEENKKIEEKKSSMAGKTLKKPEEFEKIIRIVQTDIPGNKHLFVGLTRINGVSWSLANAVCIKLGLDKKRKISSLNQEEIRKIEEFIRKPSLPEFLLNRRKDLETGENMHLIGSDLDLRKEFDIKRLKKIKSYKGLRHSLGQPVRGQRTRGHFRQKGRSVGVMKKGKTK